jgi:hypothetical protein
MKMLNTEVIDYLFLINSLSKLATTIADGSLLPNSTRRLIHLLDHVSPTRGKSMIAIWLSHFPQVTKKSGSQVGCLSKTRRSLDPMPSHSENSVDMSLQDPLVSKSSVL